MADLNALVDKWHTGDAEFIEYQEPTDTKGAQVVVDLTVAEGPLVGSRIRWWGSLRGGAKEITEKQLLAAGWTGKNIKSGAGIGRTQVRFLVKNETWNGKTRTKVVQIVTPKKFDKAAATDTVDSPF